MQDPNNEEFSDPEPHHKVPAGAELLQQLTALFPHLTPGTIENLQWMTKHKPLPFKEQQRWLNVLRDNPSAGDALFTLSSCNDPLIAWMTRDTALELAESYTSRHRTQLASLLFVELFVKVRQWFNVHALHSGCANVDQFVPIINDGLSRARERLFRIGLSEELLYRVLQYRSVENELMQNREGMITEDELASAMRISVDELKQAKALNQNAFQSEW